MNPHDEERRLRKVIDATPFAMLMVDVEGRVVLVNAQAEQLFDYPREQLMRMSVEDLLPERFRDHHRDQRRLFRGHPGTRALGAGRHLHGLRADGSEVPVEIGLSSVQIDDETFVLASIIDISERQRSEEQIRQAESALVKAEIWHLAAPRRAHRPPQPHHAARSPARRDPAGRTGPPRARRAPPRPRPLQADQRLAGPPHRRPAAPRHGRSAAAVGPRGRPGRPSRRRRVRDRVRRAGRRQEPGFAHRGADAGPAGAGQRERPRARRDGEHGRRSLPARRHRPHDPAEERRHRDAPREGRRAERLPVVLRRDARRDQRQDRHRCLAATDDRARGAVGRLPAAGGPRIGCGGRDGGAGALGQPGARTDRARSLHPGRRGGRDDPEARQVGAPAGVPGRVRDPGRARSPAPTGRERLAAAAPRRGLVVGRRRGPGRDLLRPGPARARDHRGHPDGRTAARGRAAPGVPDAEGSRSWSTTSGPASRACPT